MNILRHKFLVLKRYVPVKSKLQHPPRATPGHLNFWKIFVQIPPSPSGKAVQMPPPPGELPDYCFNFSVASIMFLKLCMWTWFIRQHTFTYYKYKSVLNTFKYGTQLVQVFGFQPIHHKYTIFEFIKVWRLRRLRHDLSRNMTLRPAIKFPNPPFNWWSISLPPGQEKTSNARGIPGGDVEASIWLIHYWYNVFRLLSFEVMHIWELIWWCLKSMNGRLLLKSIETSMWLENQNQPYKLQIDFRRGRRKL